MTRLRGLKQSARTWILLISTMAAGSTPLCAQLYTGSLTGTVFDPSNQPVSGATVVLIDPNQSARASVVTGILGRFLFRSLAPGNYSIRVEAAGFQTMNIRDIVIEVNGSLSADAKLQISQRKDSVAVQADAARAQVEDATLGLVVNRQLIDTLPLVDRNVFDLAFLAPGISQAPGTTYGNGVSTPGFVTNLVSDGSRNAQGDLLLDGVSVTNSDNNPGVQKALYVPPVDAVEEFKIQQTNFSAEFGNSGGTIVNVITRSGTNQHHGELYEFLRNNDMNANTFFANAAGLAQAHLTRNDFGGTIGGPILKNKTFFFFDVNGIRALTGQISSLAGVPDVAERSGNFGELCGRAGGTFNTAGICSNPAGQIYDPYTGQPNAQNNAINRAPIPFDNLATYISPGNPNIPFGLGNLSPTPGNLIDPVGAKLIQAFPLPNLNVGTAAYDPYHNWVATGTSPLNQQSFDIKLDQHFSDKDFLSVRFSHEWDSGQNANFFGSVYDTNTQGPTKHSVLDGDVNYVHTFNATTLVNVSLGYGHNWYPTDGVAASFGGFDPVKVLGMPSYIDTSGFLTPPSIWLFSAYGCNGFNGCLGGAILFDPEVRQRDRAPGGIRGSYFRKTRDQNRRGASPSPDQLLASRRTQWTLRLHQQRNRVRHGRRGGRCAGRPHDRLRRQRLQRIRDPAVHRDAELSDRWIHSGQLAHHSETDPEPRASATTSRRPRTERYNQMSYFDPAAASPITVPGLDLHGAVEYVGVGGNPRTEFNTYWGDIGPRFGFAYNILKNTTLRGGYGIYYDPSDLGVVGNAVSGGFLGYDSVTTGVSNVPAAPWLPLEFLRNPFPFGIQTATGSSQGPSTLLGQAMTDIPVRSLNQTPQEQTWSFDIQHQLPWSILVDAGYVGRKGTHLYAMGFGNQLDALPPSVAAAFQANPSYYLEQVPNPFYGVIQGSADLSGPTIPRWKLYVPYPQYSNGAGAGISSSFVPWANSIYNAVAISNREAFLARFAVSVHLCLSKEPGRFLAGFERLLVPGGRPGYSRIECARPEQS